MPNVSKKIEKTKEQLEKEKLEREIRSLKRPFFTPAFITPIISLGLALLAYWSLRQSGLFEAKQAHITYVTDKLTARKKYLDTLIIKNQYTVDSLIIKASNLDRQLKANKKRIEHDSLILLQIRNSPVLSDEKYKQQIYKLTVERDAETEKLRNVGGNIAKFVFTWNNFQKKMDAGTPYYELKSDLKGEVDDILNAWNYNQPGCIVNQKNFENFSPAASIPSPTA